MKRTKRIEDTYRIVAVFTFVELIFAVFVFIVIFGQLCSLVVTFRVTRIERYLRLDSFEKKLASSSYWRSSWHIPVTLDCSTAIIASLRIAALREAACAAFCEFFACLVVDFTWPAILFSTMKETRISENICLQGKTDMRFCSRAGVGFIVLFPAPLHGTPASATYQHWKMSKQNFYLHT